MKKASFDLNCPVAKTLETVGDPWSLLIVRDILMGNNRFAQFQRDLKISRNILSNRLDKLIDNGVLEKQAVPDSAYEEYVLTKKGMALTPVIMELGKWGTKWLD